MWLWHVLGGLCLPFEFDVFGRGALAGVFDWCSLLRGGGERGGRVVRCGKWVSGVLVTVGEYREEVVVKYLSFFVFIVIIA